MIRVTRAALALVFVAGCKGEESDTETEACNNSYTTFPVDAEVGVYYRTTIEADFQTVDETATLTVDGVQGTTAWRGTSLVFTPAQPLTPNTPYSFTIAHACDPDGRAFSFTVGEVGTPTDAPSLVGRTYSLDLASGRFVHPEGVGDLIKSYLTTDVLVGVVSADTAQINMLGAIGIEEPWDQDGDGTPDVNPPAQDTCNPTIPFPPADFSQNPYFIVGPETTTITVEDFAVTIKDLKIAGAFSPTATYIKGAELSGAIDTRPLVPLLDEGGEDDAICTLAASIGVSCEECSDGTGPYCLSLLVDSISAVEITGAIVPIATQEEACLRAECASDSDCQPDSGV